MADESVMELDDSHWETVVEKSEKPVVVMFYDQLCPHCMIMMPHFEKYAEDFKNQILFTRIDVARNPFAVSRYGIMATPTFKFFLQRASSSRDRRRDLSNFIKEDY